MRYITESTIWRMLSNTRRDGRIEAQSFIMELEDEGPKNNFRKICMSRVFVKQVNSSVLIAVSVVSGY
jgi:hypothetical protein